jgi:flagella basal body P-ring formation protein FlgA
MDMFQKPLLVRGNQKINLISKVGNVTVRLSARALSNGAHGDTVKVITEATDKIITACVTGPGLVSAVN